MQNFLAKAILFLTITLFTCSTLLFAQRKYPAIEILTSGVKSSIRGLSVVNDNIIWTSGSNGTIGKSLNGGKSWKWMVVKGFEKTDFRDIEAFDAVTAVIMGISEPAYILKTTNGGESWKVVYENKTRGMFLDAMDFWNEQAGIVVGDPIDGKFFIARTFDNGNSWQDIPFAKRPAADSGEGCFASSGTNIRPLDRDEAVFISGGLKSKIYIRGSATVLPMLQGRESTGANSISVYDNFKRNGGKQIIVVGGDFSNDSLETANCIFSHDGGKTWKKPDQPPHGYRSCVEYLTKQDVIACGLNGIDYSLNGGRNWKWISREGFHVCRIAKYGSAVFLAGSNGRIARLKWD